MPIDRIVVAGGGIAGWLAASRLARALHGGTTAIQVVADEGPDDSLGVGTAAETLSPRSVERSAKAGYDEDAMIRSTRGTFALGTSLTGWRDGPPAFLPFGEIGAAMGPVAFHQLAARLRSEGVTVNLANYTLAALCAQTGRFARPASEDRGVLSTLDYGINVEASAYRQFLRADSRGQGVTETKGKVVGAARDAEGRIEALITADGERTKGDLFVDASGPGTALGGTTESWSDLFHGGGYVAELHRTDETPLPFTHIEADAAGWTRYTPLQGGTGALSMVVSADHNMGRAIPVGRRTEPWQHNCVAIGGAAAVIDPVAGMQLDLAHAAVDRLTGLLPDDRACSAEAAEYNRQTIEEVDGARDVATMFYRHARHIDGSITWAPSDPRAPDRLAHKIALFESCGRTALHDGEMLDEAGWVALFEALGVRARRYDALADGIALSAIDAHFARIREVMLKAIATLPSHADYLRAIPA